MSFGGRSFCIPFRSALFAHTLGWNAIFQWLCVIQLANALNSEISILMKNVLNLHTDWLLTERFVSFILVIFFRYNYKDFCFFYLVVKF